MKIVVALLIVLFIVAIILLSAMLAIKNINDADNEYLKELGYEDGKHGKEK